MVRGLPLTFALVFAFAGPADAQDPGDAQDPANAQGPAAQGPADAANEAVTDEAVAEDTAPDGALPPSETATIPAATEHGEPSLRPSRPSPAPLADISEQTAGATAGPKVAVVLIGDPDARLRSLARRVDDALPPSVERPSDAMFRAALRGSPGTDDGLAAVRRERRRLGLSERADAPIIANLGRRSGAIAVAVVRVGRDGPELIVFDVRAAQFFEGELALDETTPPARIARFIRRRARRAGGVAAAAVAPDPAQVAAQLSTSQEDTPEEEPGFFEQFWPYMVAAVLLAGMITAIVLTADPDEQQAPVLRFVPGGR